MRKILGIGNALVDVLARIEDESLLSELHLPKGAMTLIDEQQQETLSRLIAPLKPSMATGGSASNTILALSALGARTGLIGKLGKDALGDFFVQKCEERRIEGHFSRSDHHTGVAHTLITPDGERTFGTCLGAAALLSPQDIREEAMKDCYAVHIEGYLVTDHDLMTYVCTKAREAGALVSLDLASYNVVEAHRDFLRSLVRDSVDILFANEEEATAFSHTEKPQDALSEMAGMCRVAVVKLGGDGSMAQKGDERAQAAGARVPLLDTTAAGDFFAGGFLYGLQDGLQLRQCLQCGTMMAGEVIQVMGTDVPPARFEACRQEIRHLRNEASQGPSHPKGI